MSYDSKYTGQQVEELLDQVANGEAGGGQQEVYVIDPSGEPSEVYAGLKAAWDAGVRSYALVFVLAAPCVVAYIGDEFAAAVSITGTTEDGNPMLQVLQYKITSTEITKNEAEIPLGGGGITEEDDPIFTASPAAGITEEQITSWGNKVDKVAGKQLSTEDFTAALKQKLEGLSNYDDTAISEAVDKLREDFDTLVSGDSTTAIKTFNEIIAFLSGIEDSASLDSIIASIEQQIASKQDTIADLATIREGAGKGATAVQPSSLAKVATSGSYNDLSDKPTIPAAVTVDTALSTTSTNPVQNKAVTTGINAKYTKPLAGIPKSDLAAAVQTSLGKADTALQTEQYKGTVTGVKINGSTKNPSNGVVNLGTVITDISGKQDKLVSGTNIKTINGTSILGSGDIAISGGGSSDKVEVVMLEPEVKGSEWIYHIPAGKFVELYPANGSAPSVIRFELLDPVEATLEDESDWVTEFSKYHFIMSWDINWAFAFYTNTNPSAAVAFAYCGSISSDAYSVEFDVLCSLVHYPASTGYSDDLYGYLAMAPLYV